MLTWLILAAILLAGLGVRAQLAKRNTYPSFDGVHYMEQSRGLVRNGELPFSSFPPGWPLLAALPLAFLDPNDSLQVMRAAQGTNVVFGALFPLLTFLMLRRRLPAPWPVVGAALLAMLPLAMILSKGDLSEMSYACFLLSAWLLTDRRPGPVGGLMLGYAYLIRPEAVLAAAGLWLVHLARERRVAWRYTAGLASVAVPYLIYLRVQSGHWSLSAKGVFLLRSVGERSAVEILELVAGNLRELLLMPINLIGLPLVLLAFWGMWVGRGRWLCFLLPLLPLPLFDFVMMPRFWVPSLPFLLLAAGLGGMQLAGWAKNRWPRRGSSVAATLLAGASLGGFAGAAAGDFHAVPLNPEAYVGMREAGEWLRDRVEPDTVIAGYKPYVSFWAGCRFLPYPEQETEPAIIVEYCRHQGAEYLVANVKVAHHFIRGLDPLLRSPLPPRLADKLEIVNLFEYEPAIQSTAIYRIKRPLAGAARKR